MKIRPLHDRIVVKREEEREVKKGGIIIPDTAKEKPQEGKVIAVGKAHARRCSSLRRAACRFVIRVIWSGRT